MALTVLYSELSTNKNEYLRGGIMKSLKTILAIALMSLIPALAEAGCTDQKSFIINEVKSAIALRKQACRPQLIMIGCDVLFKEKLPQLVEIISRDDYRNLKSVVSELNKSKKQVYDIVDRKYHGEVNTLISDLNTYSNQCGR